MKQGTVDAMELAGLYDGVDKFYEVTKFYSLTKHTYPPIAWFTNLPKKIRPCRRTYGRRWTTGRRPRA